MQIIATEGAPKAIGPYSQAIKSGNLLFTSGQISLDPATGELVQGDFSEHARRVFENLKAVLTEADFTKANLHGADLHGADLRSAHLQAANLVGAILIGAFLNGVMRAAAGKSNDESAELEALRAELEARKVMIKSLRADQDRVAALQATIDEKSEIVRQLEASLNRHSNTIVELKRGADGWKRKYQAVKGSSSTAETSVSVPTLSETDVRVIEQLDKDVTTDTESTIAIDMRSSLLEARRTQAKGGGEK